MNHAAVSSPPIRVVKSVESLLREFSYCGIDLVTEGLKDITGITALIDVMLNHGYAHEDINDIMGRSWLRI